MGNRESEAKSFGGKVDKICMIPVSIYIKKTFSLKSHFKVSWPFSDYFVVATFGNFTTKSIRCIYFLSHLFIPLKSVITHFTYITSMQTIVLK